MTDKRTDRRMYRRNCCRYYSALHCKQCGRAVKNDSQGGSLSARSFDLARPGIAPPLVSKQIRRNRLRHVRYSFLVVFAEYLRVGNIVVGLTNDDPTVITPVIGQYRHFNHHIHPVGATLSVSFPPTADMFRYVIIQRRYIGNENLCLAEVKVFLTGNLLLISRNMNCKVLELSKTKDGFLLREVFYGF